MLQVPQQEIAKFEEDKRRFAELMHEQHEQQKALQLKTLDYIHLRRKNEQLEGQNAILKTE